MLTECPDGLYGHECQENCSTNCIVSGSCDSMSGQCEGGCQAGWKQSKCDTSKDMQLLNICKTNYFFFRLHNDFKYFRHSNVLFYINDFG